MPACPAEEVILAFVEDRLRPEQRSSTEAHLAGCESCSALLALVAASWHTEGRLDPANEPGTRSITEGDRIGPYLVLTRAGRGAMGEVYRARDERLGRDVALKVLPARFARDPQRLARFREEARLAGALSHPNLLTVFDVGTHDGIPYLVTEWLDGTTLRNRLLSGALGRDHVLRLGSQLARGLAAAHDKGVVHRDLKPANVFIRGDGICRILDFGIARLAEGFDDPERTQESGVVVGTPGYMAPEQIRGNALDRRADLFALGAVLYEATAGRAPFGNGNAVERMSAALRDEPPLLEGELGAIVARCLAKNPAERFQSAHDLAFSLEALAARAREGSRLEAPPGRSPARAVVWSLAALATAAVTTAVLLALALVRSHAAPGEAALPGYRQVTFRRGHVLGARFSADGHSFVYAGAWDGSPPQLYGARAERPLAQPLGVSANVLAASADGELAILLTPRFFDPDHGSGTLARLPLSGGTPRAVLEDVLEADWGPSGELAVVRRIGGRFRLEHPAGTVRFESDGWISDARVSPDGERIAFLLHPNPKDDRGAVMMLGREGPPRALASDWASARGVAWAPGGREIWFTASRTGADCALWAVDLSGALRLLDRVPGRMVLHDVAADGTALVDRQAVRTGLAFVRDGVEHDLTWSGSSFLTDLSADGRTLLFAEDGPGEGPSYGAYLRTTDGAPPVRLGDGIPLALSPDDRWVLTMRSGARTECALLPTGAGQPRTLSLSPIAVVLGARWFPDGKRLLLRGSEAGRAARLWVVEPGAVPVPFTAEGDLFEAAIASRGDRIAWVDQAGALRLVSATGEALGLVPGDFSGRTVVGWSASGDAVYLKSAALPAELARAHVRTGAVTPRALLPARAHSPGLISVMNAAVSADGRVYAYSYRETLSTLYLVEGLAGAQE